MVGVEIIVDAPDDEPGRARRIHAGDRGVPAWMPGGDAEAELRQWIENLLARNDVAGVRHVVLPCIGTPSDGWPAFAAAREAMRAVRAQVPRLRSIRLITFACPDTYVAAVYRDALAAQAMLRRGSGESPGDV